MSLGPAARSATTSRARTNASSAMPVTATGTVSIAASAARASRCDAAAQVANCATVAGPAWARNVSASRAQRAAASASLAPGPGASFTVRHV